MTIRRSSSFRCMMLTHEAPVVSLPSPSATCICDQHSLCCTCGAVGYNRQTAVQVHSAHTPSQPLHRPPGAQHAYIQSTPVILCSPRLRRSPRPAPSRRTHRTLQPAHSTETSGAYTAQSPILEQTSLPTQPAPAVSYAMNKSRKGRLYIRRASCAKKHLPALTTPPPTRTGVRTHHTPSSHITRRARGSAMHAAPRAGPPSQQGSC